MLQGRSDYAAHSNNSTPAIYYRTVRGVERVSRTGLATELENGIAISPTVGEWHSHKPNIYDMVHARSNGHAMFATELDNGVAIAQLLWHGEWQNHKPMTIRHTVREYQRKALA